MITAMMKRPATRHHATPVTKAPVRAQAPARQRALSVPQMLERLDPSGRITGTFEFPVRPGQRPDEWEARYLLGDDTYLTDLQLRQVSVTDHGAMFEVSAHIGGLVEAWVDSGHPQSMMWAHTARRIAPGL
jgi:hypothetical protein